MNEIVRGELWHTANEIDALKSNIQNATDFLEIMANDSEIGEPHKGALWFLRESIKINCQLMDMQIDKLMEVHRQLAEVQKKKK